MKRNKALFVLNNLTTGGIQSQALLIAKFLKNELGFDIEFWGIKTVQDNYTTLLDKEGITYEMNSILPFIFSHEYFELNKISKIKIWARLFKQLKPRNITVIFPFACPKQMNIIKIFLLSVKASFYFERGGHHHPITEHADLYDQLVRLSKPVYLANSFHGARALEILKDLPKNKVEVIRNAYFDNGYHDTSEDWQDQLKAERTVLTFTMIANFFEYKDHFTLIQGFEILHLVNPKVRLVFAGLGGPKECQDRFLQLKQKVEDMGMAGKIIFLGSVKNTKRLLDLTDVGVLSSSSSEGCPNAILEYMHSALPVVGSSIDAIKEVLPEEQYQYLFEPGNVQNCADILLKMSRDFDGNSKNLGQVNYAKLSQDFSIQKLEQGYKNILERNHIIP